MAGRDPFPYIGGPITIYGVDVAREANFWPYSGWPVEYPPISEKQPTQGAFPSQAIGERDPNA